jgi:hypothetical protein
MDISTGNSSHLDSESLGKLLDACDKDVIAIQQLAFAGEGQRYTVRQMVESNHRFLQTNRTDTKPRKGRTKPNSPAVDA